MSENASHPAAAGVPRIWKACHAFQQSGMKEQMYQASGLLVAMVRNESKSELIASWDGWISAATIAEKTKYWACAMITKSVSVQWTLPTVSREVFVHNYLMRRALSINAPWCEIQKALSLINQNLRIAPYIFLPVALAESNRS